MTLIKPAYRRLSHGTITTQDITFHDYQISKTRYALISEDGMLMVSENPKHLSNRWEATRYSTISQIRIKLSHRFKTRADALSAIIRVTFGAHRP